jgi:PIN domain nuclease of toxin-antitoxin system
VKTSSSLLLDTHTFLWWDEGKLPRAVVRRIRSAEDVFVSAASAWEISIKAALGKIVAKASLSEAIDDYGFLSLPVRMDHADGVRVLPPYHRDPFDRMLIAQARIDGLTLVSRDAIFDEYDVPVVWD